MNNFFKTVKLIGLLVVFICATSNVIAQPSFFTNGLIAYYPFNGNANDVSGNGLNGSVYGATLTTDRFGNSNAAYYFDGVSAYISAPVPNVFTNDFTVSVWFNAYDMDNSWPSLLYEQSIDTPFFLQFSGESCDCENGTGTLQVYGYPSTFPPFSYFVSHQGELRFNSFYQAVITKAGTNMTMFLNSHVAACGQINLPVSQQAVQSMTIGEENPTDAPGYTDFHGVIDDIRIYNRALSQFEVQQLYAIESGQTFSIVKAVTIENFNLNVGSNYQVQLSTDLATWTNYGQPFTATNSFWRATNYWNVYNWDQLFFRILPQ